MHLLDRYKKLGYIVFTGNFYTGPDLFYNLLIDEKLQLVELCIEEEFFPKNSLLQSSNNGVNIKLCHITVK